MTDIDFYLNVVRNGNNIAVRGIRAGKEVRFKYKYEPTLYIEKAENHGFKTLDNKYLKPINFTSMKDCRDFVDEQKGSNLKLYGFPHFHSQFTLENYSDSVDKFDKSLIRIFNIDIEVTSDEGFPETKDADYPITAMCIYDSVADKFVTFGIGDWDENESVLPSDIADKVVYIPCENEIRLLEKFLKYWTTFTPNIVTGWNIETFDIPYIVNRLDKLGFERSKLSPWGWVDLREINTGFGREELKANIRGVDIIDYLPIYKKNRVQDSYRLDNIARIELNEQKSLGTVEMLDMSRVPFTSKLSNNVYDIDTDDAEFNRFAKIRLERVNTQNSNNPNKDLELEVLIREEKKAAFQAFISYNIQDVNLVKRLDEKMGLLDAQIMIAYEACMNFEEVSSPVRTWDCLINKEMWKNNQIPHFHVEKKSAGESIPGGYVKEPKVGKHGWCVSFDLNSLYPHLIMQFNISPETLDNTYRLWEFENDETRVNKLLNKEPITAGQGNMYSVSAAGYRFSNEKEGIIPRLMRKMYQDRKAFKKKMLEKQKKGLDDSVENLRQYVLKILLNSGYGALVNQYFRWFDRRMGMSITLSGQYVIRVAEKTINEWMNKVVGTTGVDYIIAIDTDSNYVDFQPLVDKFFKNKTKDEIVDIIDKIAQEQVQKALEKGFEESAEYLSAFEQKMVMEREAIASSAFWTAKKRYAMCVWDMEGVRMPADKPKLKIQGLEAIRSSTPYVCRQPLLDIIKLTLLEDEKTVQEYIASFKEEFLDFSGEQIAMPRTMNNMAKFLEGGNVRKGTPVHIRGAHVFNRMLEHHELTKTWETIMSGEKGKFIYLTLPNSVNSDVISFTTSIPKEFNLDKYIDKHKMFDKIILDPVKGILEPIGWTAEEVLSLESFFG